MANGLNTVPEMHLDEYPYASTQEGGANAAANSIPANENRDHGLYLAYLVRTNKMKTGDKFLIQLIPNTKQPSTYTVFQNVTNDIPDFNTNAVKKITEAATYSVALTATISILNRIAGRLLLFMPLALPIYDFQPQQCKCEN